MLWFRDDSAALASVIYLVNNIGRPTQRGLYCPFGDFVREVLWWANENEQPLDKWTAVLITDRGSVRLA
jgi:hypothetical protein